MAAGRAADAEGVARVEAEMVEATVVAVKAVEKVAVVMVEVTEATCSAAHNHYNPFPKHTVPLHLLGQSANLGRHPDRHRCWHEDRSPCTTSVEGSAAVVMGPAAQAVMVVVIEAEEKAAGVEVVR